MRSGEKSMRKNKPFVLHPGFGVNKTETGPRRVYYKLELRARIKDCFYPSAPSVLADVARTRAILL